MKLTVRDLTKTYRTNGQIVEVLTSVNLEVNEGEFVTIIGPSGCGKTTLLNIVAGFVGQTAGEVLANGLPVVGPDPRRIMVFQERGVFPWLNVADNIGFGLSGCTREERDRRIAHYVELVGLAGFENTYPDQLSGGMKQRVEVARALAVDPEMLFLDEPFGALDSITRMVMRGELLRIWQAEKKTILFVTHDIDEAIQLADRVAVMSTRPATIRRIVDIDIEHPRDLSGSRYLELRDGLFEEIGLAHSV